MQTIVFLAALPDQPYPARIRHDHFVSQVAQHTTDPGRMRPDFQRDATARHRAEDFLQCFRCRPHSLLQLDLAGFIHHAVPDGMRRPVSGRDAVRSRVIDVLKAQIKRRPAIPDNIGISAGN
jgi:hypothetical protein